MPFEIFEELSFCLVKPHSRLLGGVLSLGLACLLLGLTRLRVCFFIHNEIKLLNLY